MSDFTTLRERMVDRQIAARGVASRLPGFKSRCTKPASCAAVIPSAIWTAGSSSLRMLSVGRAGVPTMCSSTR